MKLNEASNLTLIAGLFTVESWAVLLQHPEFNGYLSKEDGEILQDSINA